MTWTVDYQQYLLLMYTPNALVWLVAIASVAAVALKRKRDLSYWLTLSSVLNLGLFMVVITMLRWMGLLEGRPHYWVTSWLFAATLHSGLMIVVRSWLDWKRLWLK